ncbi:MAG: RNA polymerase sigma factor [Planctomycetota bacterium]
MSTPDAETDDTPALTTAMARGERSAVETFYRRHFDGMLADASRNTRRDEHFCLDVVQDATLKIVRSIKPMRDAAHLRRWVRRVVLNAAIDRLRAEQRRSTRERAVAGAPSIDPADDVELAERIADLRRRVGRLDAASRRLLLLRHVRNMTLADIGRKLGLGPGGVDSRLRRIVRRVRTSHPEQP